MWKFRRIAVLLSVLVVFFGVLKGEAAMQEPQADVIRKLLESKELNMYLHLGPADTFYVVALQGPKAGEADFTIKGAKVVFVSGEKDAASKFVFVVTKYDVSGTGGRVEFAYPQEGVVGSADITVDSGALKLAKISIAER